MRDFVHDRKKNLDVVLCTPSSSSTGVGRTLKDLIKDYKIDLSPTELGSFNALPSLPRTPVGSVLLALEAKATMTAHQRALPRLYDELNSSHATVHGATDHAIAVGFVMINIADVYLSPDLNKRNRATDPHWSRHMQPRDAVLVIDKVKQLPKRSKVGDVGYDALAIALINAANDGSEVRLVTSSPAPQPGDIYHYSSMIDRAAHIYAMRFKDL
jgi:hypothetical protein